MRQPRPLRPLEYAMAILDNLNTVAWQKGKGYYMAQHSVSCTTIYGLCVAAFPDVVIDIGTAGGASCLMLALALHHLKRSVDRLHTIGFAQQAWSEAWDLNEPVLERNGMVLKHIYRHERDFRNCKIEDFAGPEDRVMIFYDIHDDRKCHDDYGENCSSKILTESWLPKIKEGLVVCHDFYECNLGTWKKRRSEGLHWSGRHFVGYDEVKHIIDWVNECKGNVVWMEHGSLILFWVKDGKAI